MQLKVNDRYYTVKTYNTTFTRQKVHQVINGEDWFRYDELPRTYSICEYKVLGVLQKDLFGIWPHDWDVITEYHVADLATGNVHETGLVDERYFMDKEEAEAYMGVLQAQSRTIDLALAVSHTARNVLKAT